MYDLYGLYKKHTNDCVCFLLCSANSNSIIFYVNYGKEGGGIVSLVICLCLFLSTSAFALTPEKETGNTESPDGDNEYYLLDVDDALENGIYSDDGQYVIYDDCVFIVKDLEAARQKLETEQNLMQVQSSMGLERYAYELLSSNIFYSKGSQDVLARITLNPGQSGSFGLGSEFVIKFEASAGVDEADFEASIGSGFTQSYQVTVNFDVDNTESYLRTAALGCVFMTHYYNVYDRGFF